jgi:hypothetical protein
MRRREPSNLYSLFYLLAEIWYANILSKVYDSEAELFNLRLALAVRFFIYMRVSFRWVPVLAYVGRRTE